MADDLRPNEPTAPAPPAAPPAGEGPGRGDALAAYVRANRSSFTESALRAAAIAAGNDPADVDAALAAARDVGIGPPVDRGRMARNVFIWYLGVYLVLGALIVVNPANENTGGFLGDVRWIGLLFLSMALGAGVIASLVWIGSRRVFVGLVGAGAILYALPVLFNPYSGGLILGGTLLAIGIGLIAAAATVAIRPGVPAMPTSGLLLSVPLLILLAVGGVCVVSGLPIPRPA